MSSQWRKQKATGESPFPIPSMPPADPERLEKRLREARRVIRAEARTIAGLEHLLDARFSRALDLILGRPGKVVVCGMGKAGLVGQKVSATFASTGTESIFLHPAEAVHGDLGRIRKGDTLLALSNSGESVELLRMIPPARKIGAAVIGITGAAQSNLALMCDVVLEIGSVDEACPLGLAPTASTTAMLVLGDALAMTLVSERSFSREDYALYHPAGSLGRKLLHVGEIMRQGEELPLVGKGAPLHEVFRVMTRTPGRPGCAFVVDAQGLLVGIFTDGDLRRLLDERGQLGREESIDAVMVRGPKCVRAEVLVGEAERLLHEYRIDQLPVVDEHGRPVGLIDVQDLLDTHY